jgi:uncharacterized membrane protein YhaH (DUF805 family)
MRKGQMHWTDILFSTHGRLRRRDFWLWFVIKTIAIPVLAVAIVGLIMLMKLDKDTEMVASVFVMALACGAYAVSNLALISKRWHDRNKTGWLYLVLFVPVIGWLWTFIECGLLDGTPGRNHYGRSPKGLGEEAPLF